MKIFVVIFVALFVASANSLSLIACGQNEVYSDCGCNDLTCDNQFKVCPIVCRSGCYCDAGFVRNAANMCVAQAECPQTVMTCKKNEIYNACGSLSSEPHCDALFAAAPFADAPFADAPFADAPIADAPVAAAQFAADPFAESLPLMAPVVANKMMVCESGCYCKPGFFRNNKGNCVKQQNCEKTQCPDKEVYKTCGSGCGELTCDRPTFENVKCPAVCRVGCTCKSGFVRNKEGTCIKEHNCPQHKCNKKSEIYQCGVKRCQAVCDKPIDEVCTYSKFRCIDDCFCKEGFIRESIDGPCIPEKKCNRILAQSCNAVTEKYVLGVKPCEEICGKGVDPACAYTDYFPMKACFCKKGYIREEKSGQCIPVAQCQQSKCSIENEEIKCGVKGCEFVCGVGVDEFCTRARFMCKDGCFCKSGFVRDVNGKCIPEASCPPMAPVKPIPPMPMEPMAPVKQIQPMPMEPMAPVKQIQQMPMQPMEVKPINQVVQIPTMEPIPPKQPMAPIKQVKPMPPMQPMEVKPAKKVVRFDPIILVAEPTM